MTQRIHKLNPTKPIVFGTGLVALDLVVSADAPIRAWAGGTCGNVLTVLSFLGWDSYPIARLNADAASAKVKADFQRWGVHIDFSGCSPATDTPIIVQKIVQSTSGFPQHRFVWACPECGSMLPSYQPVTKKAAESVCTGMGDADVFFFDRVSPAAIDLARHAAERGALVVFEPSARSQPRLLAKALSVAHVIKYSHDRNQLTSKGRPSPGTLLEICTLGEKGLRFRSWLPGSRVTTWEQMRSVAAPTVADTCGAGDWCTAGFISILGSGGYAAFKELTSSDVKNALRYGQALAAWNCGFEGARGGMYAVGKRSFANEIESILAGKKPSSRDGLNIQTDAAAGISCPACPPKRQPSTVHSLHRPRRRSIARHRKAG